MKKLLKSKYIAGLAAAAAALILLNRPKKKSGPYIPT